MNKKDLFKNLTNEQLNKARACKNQEELLALAQQEGIELTDEQLEAVSGGCGHPIVIGPCPNCDSTNIDAEVCVPCCDVIVNGIAVIFSELSVTFFSNNICLLMPSNSTVAYSLFA